MKFSENWLREWVPLPGTTAELSAQLTMAGLEVDSVAPAGAEFSGVVVGHVIEVNAHPDADKLRVCRVEVGAEQTLQIVCGAPNVHVGMHAPTARVGATLPGGLKISRARLRGVESAGMLCSAGELGLGEARDGLMRLPADSVPGFDIRELLDIDDWIIDIDLTPNRGDCLSVAGVAREVAVLNRSELSAVSVVAVAALHEDTFPVTVQAPADCPRYAGRVIRGVDARAPTPLWMMERLRRAGIRSLGPLVDVTNYVMLELGQPMHAFDLSRLEGGIVVRRAREQEQLRLLDGSSVDLDAGTLVIADHSRVVALAGIMGGEASGCDDDTRDVFLESAFFAPTVIVGKARAFGMHTESSHRFERGVDPELQTVAIERATRLLIDIAGGEPGPVTEQVANEHLPRRATITLRATQLTRLLGQEIPAAEVVETLQHLGMQVTGGPQQWQVVPPGFRFDIDIEVDLVEEIARVHGYERLPSNRPLARFGLGERPEGVVGHVRIRSLLVDRDYHEAITYSFVDSGLQALLDPDHQPIPLANPISQDMGVMRTSLWPGLVAALKHNLARQQTRVRLFEMGLVFQRGVGQTLQSPRLGGLVYGDVLHEQWGAVSRPVDFFDIKGDLEALLALTGRSNRFEAASTSHPALHPGRCARLQVDGKLLGWVGALHPGLERELDLAAPVYLFELELAAVTAGCVPGFQQISRYPAIRRDLAVVIEESISAQTVRSAALAAGGELVKDLLLFDVYSGKGVEPGRKSLAIGLILQADSRTLKDQEVDEVVARVMASLAEKLGAVLRV